MIEAVPRATADTRPAEVTVATLWSLELHTRLLLVAEAGRTVGYRVVVAPGCMLSELEERVTPDTGTMAVTVTVLVAIFEPSAWDEAMMTAEPAATPVTRPCGLTVATAWFELFQDTF